MPDQHHFMGQSECSWAQDRCSFSCFGFNIDTQSRALGSRWMSSLVRWAQSRCSLSCLGSIWMLNLVLWVQDRCSFSCFGLKFDAQSRALGPRPMLTLVLWAQSRRSFSCFGSNMDAKSRALGSTLVLIVIGHLSMPPSAETSGKRFGNGRKRCSSPWAPRWSWRVCWPD